jgi:hypothetical protein
VADTKPTADNVVSVEASTSDAQKNVQTVLDNARAVAPAPIAQDKVVPPLTVADKDLSSAFAKEQEMQKNIDDMKRAIDNSESARKFQVKTLEDNIDAVKAAVAADRKANADKLQAINKEYESANKEIDSLKNEVLRKAKFTLMGIALVLFLGGALSLIASFYPMFAGVTFAAGPKVTIATWPLAALCLTVAFLLTKIVFWTAIFAGVALLAGLGYLAYELYQHAKAAPTAAPTAAASTAPVAAAKPVAAVAAPVGIVATIEADIKKVL